MCLYTAYLYFGKQLAIHHILFALFGHLSISYTKKNAQKGCIVFLTGEVIVFLRICYEDVGTEDRCRSYILMGVDDTTKVIIIFL